jgi:small conductance mechanosensitive channel
MSDAVQNLDQVKASSIDLAVRFGPKLFVAIVIVLAGLLVARWTDRFMHRLLGKLELELPIQHLLATVARIMVVGLFVILALQNLGVELLPLIAGLGVVGAGIALAMQGVLGNLVAGLTIIFTRPFRVGEYISIVGEEGLVQDIGLFNTVLGHTDLSSVVIPNRKIAGEILHNYGSIRQVEVVVAVSYDTDIDAALAAVREVVQGNPRVLKDRAPVIQATVLGDWAIKIAAKPWVGVADYGPVTGDLNKAIVEAFRARGIVMPLPQREVRMLAGTATSAS